MASALDYSPLSREQKLSVYEVVKDRLLTPFGLRTLAKDEPQYAPIYEGTQRERDIAYHNGTVWVWQLEYYVRCGFELYGKDFAKEAKKIFDNFDEAVKSYCIGSISEIFDAETPHTPRGAISQAWSVGAVLQIEKMMKENNH